MTITTTTPYPPRGARPDRLPDGAAFPVTGWPLFDCITLDAASPGWLRHVMGAGLLWRNSVWMSLARGILDAPAPFLERALGEPVDERRPFTELLRDVAGALRCMRPAAIIEAAFGACPPGLKGAVGKIGLEPFRTSEAYVRLYDLFASSDAGDRQRRRVVEQLGSLDEDRLDAVLALDLGVLTPTLATRITSAAQAADLNARLALIRSLCSSATDDALRHSLEHCARWRGVSMWAREWLAKADQMPSGLAISDPDIEPVTPANAAAVGRKFQNCLGSKAGRIASGVWSIFLWRPERVLVSTTKLADGSWLLTGVHAEANCPVPRQKVEKVIAKFRALGVYCALPAQAPREFEVMDFEFGGDLFDLELGD